VEVRVRVRGRVIRAGVVRRKREGGLGPSASAGAGRASAQPATVETRRSRRTEEQAARQYESTKRNGVKK
jgi:hypothetical protein